MRASDMMAILGIIRGSLPSLYLQQTADDAQFMAEHWASLFEDYPVELVSAAVQQYCFTTTDRKNFPVPSDILAEVEKLVEVVKHCSRGYLVEEYFKDAIKRFPPSVREYINHVAAIRYQKAFGKPFRSQAQLAAESNDPNYAFKKALYAMLLKMSGGVVNKITRDDYGLTDELCKKFEEEFGADA